MESRRTHLSIVISSKSAILGSIAEVRCDMDKRTSAVQPGMCRNHEHAYDGVFGVFLLPPPTAPGPRLLILDFPYIHYLFQTVTSILNCDGSSAPLATVP